MLLPLHQESAARLLARILLPATLVAAVVLGALVWWWTDQSQDEIRPALASTTLAQTPAIAGTETSVAVTQLELARTALLEGRLLSPAGNNAVEYYLRALETEADASGARQALLELIPEATLVLESTIESGELAEAERELALFKQMGVSELRLTPIRDQLAQARAQALAASTARTAPETRASAPARERTAAFAAPAVVAIPTSPAIAPAPVAAPTQAPAITVALKLPTAASAEPAVAPKIADARQIADNTPVYPSNAKQRRIEGWVELELAVGADGSVGDVNVIASDPARVFDREAIRAAKRWRFEPRRVDGVATATSVRKKLSFKLGNL